MSDYNRIREFRADQAEEAFEFLQSLGNGQLTKGTNSITVRWRETDHSEPKRPHIRKKDANHASDT